MEPSNLDSSKSRHQLLQMSLASNSTGGPYEQRGSTAKRLRNTRSCQIYHSSLQEPLAPYKSLEPLNPRWPRTFHRLHLHHGIRVVDQDTIVVSARDKIEKTRKGLVRTSSGTVTYSATHRLKVELDVEMLAQICGDDVPGGGHSWTPKRLEWVFKERTGRPGSWKHYDIGMTNFLCLFPKTFELFAGNTFVRLRRGKGRGHVLDHVEDVMAHLGQVAALGPGALSKSQSDSILPELGAHRMKAAYVPYEPGSTMSAQQPPAADTDNDNRSTGTERLDF
jgi:hypothetical protein